MIRLLATCGRAPAEGRLAVGAVVAAILAEAAAAGVSADAVPGRAPDRHGPGSVLLLIDGAGAERFARAWTGSVQVVARSTLRPGHGRKNWFVGVSALPEAPPAPTLDPRDVALQTLRAGGPGGQHQNTTESAVRATHRPTGLAATARDERSQHRNRALALRRLAVLVSQLGEPDRLAADRAAQAAHDRVVRGAPVRVLR